MNLEDVERQLLVQALERAGGNQTQAGHLLGINRDQVRYRDREVRPAAAANAERSGTDLGVSAVLMRNAKCEMRKANSLTR